MTTDTPPPQRRSASIRIHRTTLERIRAVRTVLERLQAESVMPMRLIVRSGGAGQRLSIDSTICSALAALSDACSRESLSRSSDRD